MVWLCPYPSSPGAATARLCPSPFPTSPSIHAFHLHSGTLTGLRLGSVALSSGCSSFCHPLPRAGFCTTAGPGRATRVGQPAAGRVAVQPHVCAVCSPWPPAHPSQGRGDAVVRPVRSSSPSPGPQLLPGQPASTTISICIFIIFILILLSFPLSGSGCGVGGSPTPVALGGSCPPLVLLPSPHPLTSP